MVCVGNRKQDVASCSIAVPAIDRPISQYPCIKQPMTLPNVFVHRLGEINSACQPYKLRWFEPNTNFHPCVDCWRKTINLIKDCCCGRPQWPYGRCDDQRQIVTTDTRPNSPQSCAKSLNHTHTHSNTDDDNPLLIYSQHRRRFYFLLSFYPFNPTSIRYECYIAKVCAFKVCRQFIVCGRFLLQSLAN